MVTFSGDGKERRDKQGCQKIVLRKVRKRVLSLEVAMDSLTVKHTAMREETSWVAKYF